MLATGPGAVVVAYGAIRRKCWNGSCLRQKDEEWTVIEPRLKSVMKLQTESRMVGRAVGDRRRMPESEEGAENPMVKIAGYASASVVNR